MKYLREPERISSLLSFGCNLQHHKDFEYVQFLSSLAFHIHSLSSFGSDKVRALDFEAKTVGSSEF